jgi:hypothetical protein
MLYNLVMKDYYTLAEAADLLGKSKRLYAYGITKESYLLFASP